VFRTIFFFLLFCFSSSVVFANDGAAILEEAVKANSNNQPGLNSFQVVIETPRIAEMIGRMTSDVPRNIAKPQAPVLVKYWQREPYQSIVTTLERPDSVYVERMAKQAVSNLAVELDRLILPAEKTAQRRDLLKDSTIKTSEVSWAGTTLHRIEIEFYQPVNLEQAFYTNGLRLPQKDIRILIFDIDAKSKTVGEMLVKTEEEQLLVVEVRYVGIPGGYLPQRVQATSTNGDVDELFEVELKKVNGFTLPASMKRTSTSRDVKDEIEVTFKDYRINQPPPAFLHKSRALF